MSGHHDVAALRAMLRSPEVQEAASRSGVFASTYEGTDDPAPSIAQRRRARRATGHDPVGVASLMVDDEGIQRALSILEESTDAVVDHLGEQLLSTAEVRDETGAHPLVAADVAAPS